LKTSLTCEQVTAQRKLPALYLLDSIVKNVGTPYTIYFSRGLYKTYMDAYASVDHNTRRKMEEMLKTWMEPVPGSIDPRPVFQPEATKPIVNALIQARSSAFQASREQARNEQQLLRGGKPLPTNLYRNTPTPPGVRAAPPLAPPYGQPAPPGPNGNPYAGQQQAYPIHPVSSPADTLQSDGRSCASQAQIPPQPTPQPPPSAPAAMPFLPPSQAPAVVPGAPPGISIASLNDDIERLISVSKTAWGQNIHDTSIQAKLKALLDLQELLRSQNLQLDKLMLVKTQIDALSVNLGHKTQHDTPTPPIGAASYRPPSTSSPPVAAPVAPPASAPPAGVSIDGLLGRGALAALLSRGPTTPQGSASHPPAPSIALLRSPPPQQGKGISKPAGAASSDPMALLGALRKSGILPSVGHAPSATGTKPLLAPTPVSITGLAGVISPLHPGAPREALQEIRNDIILRAASLKQ